MSDFYHRCMGKWKALDAFLYGLLVKSNVFDVSYGNIKSIALNALIWISLTTEKAVRKIFDLTGSCENSDTQTNFCFALFSVQTSITADVWGFYKFYRQL